MARVELGKGSGSHSTVNIFDAGTCVKETCPYGDSNNAYCVPHNGSRTIVFYHGVTHLTVDEVKRNAPCIKQNVN